MIGANTLGTDGVPPSVTRVDWDRFSRSNDDGIDLLLFNPHDFAVHVFVCVWGI